MGLDTAVVVRLLTGEPPSQARVAARRVMAAAEAGDEILVSDLVVAETYFALQHHYRLTKAQAVASLAELFTASPLRAAGAAHEVLATRNLARARPGLVDRLIQAGYGSLEAILWTFEESGSRLRSVEVLKG